jgi:predicted Zn-dependent protease
MLVRSRASAVLVALTLSFCAACATNPVTGERQLALISEAQELEMGKAAAAEVRQTLGLVDDPELQSYVQRVGVEMARTSQRPNLPWSFGVVDDPTPNAFALPGGYIFITRGLMSLMNSEAELASVLGHEIGHVTARHSVTQISRQQLAQLGLGLGGILFPEVQPFSDAIGAGLGLLFLKHGRDAERQADRLGFEYALAENYDMREMADVFAALERSGDEQRSALPAWLTTHPASGERIQMVQQWIGELPPGANGMRVEDAPFLQQIDGMTFGENPRHGFFRNGTFYHPELRFQFRVPQEWNTQNLTDAVVAVSPNRDAAFQLTLAGDANPSRAAQMFFSQPGTRVLQSAQQSINGAPAVVTVFDAATPQDVVRGVVAHVTHRGRTYQLLGYTPQPRFAAYDGAFEYVIGSFDDVTDPAVLNVQPDRLDVVEVPQRMTLQQFAQRYRSSVPVAELARINQLESPSATVEAGTLLKRVTS